MNKSKIISALAIASSVVIASYFLARSWSKTHYSYQTLSVTGLGTKDFTSDLIVWRASFSRAGQTLSETNRLIKSDNELIKSFLNKKGIKENEISFTTMQVNRNYKNLYNNEGNVTGSAFDGFTISQMVVVESKNLSGVEKMSSEISDVIEQGVELTAQEPDYYFTRLKDLKIELLKQATEDAYIRAQTIADNAKSRVGTLKNAGMGIFQITGQNSNEDYSWGGSFNTKAKYKTASITVKLEFDL
jgi:uncharacterized protein